ncbi:MAG: tetratricopeptide repeat protein [Gemmatimonadales bacterium]
MRTVRNIAVLTLGMLPATLLAQAAQPPRWAEAKCDLKAGHFLVNSGILYLKSASNTRFEDQRQKDLRDAQRSLTQALTTGDQEKNPAAWYYLGRYYILANDAQGADTAFARAQALKPDCKDDIAVWRRYVWVPTFNAGVAAWQANNNDSAIASFRRANAMLPDEPTGYKYLSTLLFNSGQGDSAVAYFRRAADVSAKDSKFAQDRKDALYNLGRIQHSQQHFPEAEAAYREYLALYPGDPEILAALGSVVMQRGNKDSAFAIYRQILSRADSMGYVPLYRAGVEISQAVPDEPDTAAAGTSCRSSARAVRPALTAARIRVRCDSVTTGMAKDYVASSRVSFQLAAQLLDASLKLNPYYRETLIHRANTALGMHDSVTALEMSRRLLAIDPMNKTAIRMMAFSQQATGRVDSTLYYLRLADSTLVADVTVSQFDSTDTGRVLKGLVTNLRSSPTPPLKLMFEFLNAKGEVVASQTAEVPTVAPEQSQQFELKATGPGIVAWRYKRG